MMTLSPQCQALYKILLRSDYPLSAKQLASQLHIFQPTVYRLTKPLIDIGLVTKTVTYPYQFAAKGIGEGSSLFLLWQNEWFSRQFSSYDKHMNIGEKERNSQSQEMSLSFVQSREELMNQSAREITVATKSVDLLRSGHEIPSDVMLATVEAKKRNVPTRMLIQDYSPDNSDQIMYWQRNGILVRKTSKRHIRLMIYDASVVYFMSHKHVDSEKDLGIRICYPPLAVIFSKLFDEWWREAEKI